LLLLALLIAACATDHFAPPPVSSTLIARARCDHVTAQQVSQGRVLFLHRCLECHTLPVVTKYSRDEWPHLVSRMASRADLTPAEEQSIVAYLRAAATR
jgi:mono/diheme cytochrome c family protein